MNIRPKDNTTIFFGTDIKVMVKLNPKQIWIKSENKVPGFYNIVRQNIRLILKEDDINNFFVV